MNEQKLNRYYWLDIAKSIGIFLIVLSHLPNSQFTADFLWTFHVPLFFFISGFLFKPAENNEFLQKLGLRLVLPYIYIYLANVLLVVLISQNFNINHIISMIIGMFWGTHAYPDFVNAALWFLPGLILVELGYFFLIRKSSLYYLPLLLVSVFLYQKGYLNLFFSVDLALLGLNYYIAGALVRNFKLIETIKSNTLLVIVLFLLSLLATIGYANMGNVWYGGKNYIISLSGAAFGILMVVSLSILLETWSKPLPLITFISKNTLFIFCFHKFSNSFASLIISSLGLRFLPGSTFLITVVSIAILIPVNMIVLKFLPELIGIKRTGTSG